MREPVDDGGMMEESEPTPELFRVGQVRFREHGELTVIALEWLGGGVHDRNRRDIWGRATLRGDGKECVLCLTPLPKGTIAFRPLGTNSTYRGERLCVECAEQLASSSPTR